MRIHEDVMRGLERGAAVVALESAVITAGLPREVFAKAKEIDGEWDVSGGTNFELVRAMERTVRKGGAIPASVAVIDGEIRVGLCEDELRVFASDERAEKAASRDLAHVMVKKESAGTTVSATLAVMKMVNRECEKRGWAGRMRVFATGGIGGVHREWSRKLDVSADLRAIAQTKACVVCAGVKSILDVRATLEALEALEVVVLGYRTDVFPQFQCAGEADVRVARRVDDARSVAELCEKHWGCIGHEGGVIAAQSVPAKFAMEHGELERAITAAERAANEAEISG
ncbi:MAG TPA: pseudouridine-5'-phosphate glycosidase, partial [Phycisphaerales bacterium]|nr:pseudouridine-5'-phosphate glycosidase [Phycisphaerales bacterium]